MYVCISHCGKNNLEQAMSFDNHFCNIAAISIVLRCGISISFSPILFGLRKKLYVAISNHSAVHTMPYYPKSL